MNSESRISLGEAPHAHPGAVRAGGDGLFSVSSLFSRVTCVPAGKIAGFPMTAGDAVHQASRRVKT